MDMAALLTPDGIVAHLQAHSKKHAIQEISTVAARHTGLPERDVFDTLLQRERLGSTGVGNGIAIPHGKLVGLDRLSGFFFQLARPVDFESLDDRPVDLIFTLLAPEDAGADHLKALAKIARLLRAPGIVEELRNAETTRQIYDLITRAPAAAAAS